MKLNNSKPLRRCFLIVIGCLLSLTSIAILPTRPVKADDYLPVVHVSGSLGSSQTWTAGNVYMIHSSVGVSSGVTLTIEPGAIVKVWPGSHIGVGFGGALNVTGTAIDPVLFTSYKDDSAGGDSNGDGSSAGAPGDYGTAITVGNIGTANVHHATFRNGWQALECSYSTGEINLTDNRFQSGLNLMACDNNSSIIAANEFQVDLGAAIQASFLDLTDIVLTGVNKNTFVGTGKNKVIHIYYGNIPLGSNWTVDGETGGVLEVDRMSIQGTLNLNNGSIVKVMPSNNILVGEGGSLNINGSTASPVIFTSIKDDGVGGDTNGDGLSSGSVGDYGTAITWGQNAHIQISHAKIKYGFYAFDASGGQANIDADIQYVNMGMVVSGDAKVIFRGSITEFSNKGIVACNWNQSCIVDAAYVDWGSSQGPFVSQGTDKVCGKVTVSPWNVGGSTAEGSTFSVKNCDNSPTPRDELVAAQVAHQQHIAQRRIDCNNGFEDACQAITNAFGCLGGAIQLAASQSPIPVSFNNPTETVDTVGSTLANASDVAIRAVEAENVQTFTMNVANKLLGVVGLYNSLLGAYQSCHP